VHDSDRGHWGFFRRPALLGPTVGFLVFLASEAVKAQASGSADGMLWLPLLLIVVNVVAAIPCFLGALILLAICRALPGRLVRFAPLRVILGGLVGGLSAWPFTHALNLIPSSTADPRFDFTSLLVGCIVAGAYCAVFLSMSRSGAPAENSLERTDGK
jgi:hypothetical protein